MQKKEGNDKPHTREEVFQGAFDELCKALDKFGPEEILDILITNSRQDPVVFYLLTRFPTVVAISEFLSSLRTVKTDKRTFNRLRKRGWIL